MVESLQRLSFYDGTVFVDAHEVHGRKHDPFHRMIAGFMTKIEERMKKLPGMKICNTQIF